MGFYWQDFLRGQEQSYSQIRAKERELVVEGTRTDTSWAAQRGTFGIALLPSPEAARCFAEFSRKIAQEVPAVIYAPEHLHTSLMGMPFANQFRYDPENLAHRHTLEQLVLIASHALALFKSTQCEVTYRTYLYTPEAVLAMGEPGDTFGELMKALHTTTNEMGLTTVRFGWGSHMTVSRFAETRPPDKLHNLVSILESGKGPGLTGASKIAVGYSHWESRQEGTVVKLGQGEGHFIPYRTFTLGR